jgi:uncharacterized protein
MSSQIRIILEGGEAVATLSDSPTAAAIREALPLEGTISRWGHEIYFTIPVAIIESPDARQDMAVGELGYWPVGTAFCIFFGPTPASMWHEPRAYSNVNPFGQVEGEPEAIKELFAGTNEGQLIRVVAA